MKGKKIAKNLAIAIGILTIAVYAFSQKIIAKPQAVTFATEDSPADDSLEARLSDDEKILQLYIYDSHKAMPDFGNFAPSGVFFHNSSIKSMHSDVQKVMRQSQAPLLNIVDPRQIFDDLPNYMNPLAVKASDFDSEVFAFFKSGFSDTLRKVGINTVYENFGIVDREIEGNASNKIEKHFDISFINNSLINGSSPDKLSVTRISKTDEIKKALLSDCELIMGDFAPEFFLASIKNLTKKDKKLATIVNTKISKILQIKKWQSHQNITAGCFAVDAREAQLVSTSKTMSCLANDHKFLPLKDLSEITIVQIGGIRQNGFLSRASSYCQYKYYYSTPKIQDASKIIKSSPSGTTILLIDNSLKDRQLITLINKAAQSSKTCVVNFNNPDNYKFIHGKSEIQVFGNSYISGDYAAQAVFGGMLVDGKFPIEAPSAKAMSGHKLEPTRFQYCTKKECGFKKNYCDTIDSIVDFAIRNNCFPGCQIFASVKGKVIINKGFGHFTYDNSSRAVSTTDLYDIASLTKITAPTLLSMYLTQEKLIDPNKKLGDYFSEEIDWSNLPGDTIINGRDTTIVRRDIPKTTVYDVTIKSILEHRSGIDPYVPIFKFIYTKASAKRCAKALGIEFEKLSDKELEEIMFNEYFSSDYEKGVAETRYSEGVWLKNNYRDSLFNYIMRLKVSEKKNFKYSDVNMILLQMAAENILKRNPADFLQEKFYGPLGMRNTCYRPYNKFSSSRIAPTEKEHWTQKYRCGDVHDPSAALLGGISGNAGIFSTAHDIATLMQMLINGGSYGGNKYLDSKTVKNFTSKQPNTGRALGFDMVPSAFAAATASASTFGHTGFTGTCAWADPENDIVIVFLSNRVYPTADNKNINTLKIRRLICQAIYDGLAKQ